MNHIEKAREMRKLIEQAAQALDDNTALFGVCLYPNWSKATTYAVDFKVRRKDKLWRCIQAHTAQVGWEPENAASLWVQINETQSGTVDNPIPYNGNMVLENGKYYTQDNNVYLCIRDTINPVYHALSALVGLYVEVA